MEEILNSSLKKKKISFPFQKIFVKLFISQISSFSIQNNNFFFQNKWITQIEIVGYIISLSIQYNRITFISNFKKKISFFFF